MTPESVRQGEQLAQDEIYRLEAALAAATERVRVLLEALAHVEWGGEDDSTHEQTCPDCKAYKWDGHQFMCKLATALAQPERQP